MKAFCREIDHPVILLGGKEDVEDGNLIAAEDPQKIYNACGKFNINESADLIRGAKLVITNDTGLMHIATAFKRPVISLWGNTVPEFGMYPYYGENYLSAIKIESARSRKNPPYEILEIRNLKCRPCSKIGYRRCPLGHFKCMEMIETSMLLKRVYDRIRQPG